MARNPHAPGTRRALIWQALVDRGPALPRELAEHLGITAQHVSALAAGMRKLGTVRVLTWRTVQGGRSAVFSAVQRRRKK